MKTEQLVKQIKDVKNFNQISLRDFGNLYISQGTEESLVIEAEKETLEKIISEVKYGKLHLKIGKNWQDRIRSNFTTSLTRQTINYYIVIKDLTQLEISGTSKVEISPINIDSLALSLGGSADIDLENLQAEHLEVNLSGNGSIISKGNVSDQVIHITGTGNYQALELSSKIAKISINGTGSANVWVTDHLEATIHGIGEIGYLGSPEVHKKVVGGIGQIKRIETEKV
jgi:hypothetical protein